MKRSIPLLSLLMLSLLSACRKTNPGTRTDQPSTDFPQLFDQFWNKMNVNYVYWDIDTTDWDKTYTCYRPLFGRLDLRNQTDIATGARYFREMTSSLIDNHLSISFGDSVIVPANQRLMKSPGFRKPLSFLLPDQHYLDQGGTTGVDFTTDPANPQIVLTGTIGKNILFFGCNRFSLSASFHAGDNSVYPLLSAFFEDLRKDSDYRGIILDLRDNPGGDLADLSFFCGQFIGHQRQLGTARYKSGNGRLDYTSWYPVNILSSGRQQDITVPVIILADVYSASVAELVAMTLRTLANCKIVGEKTFGATGPFVENGVYNDGPFSLAGYISVVTSSVEFRYIDGKTYEGKGFPPDFPVPFDFTAISSGIDPQLEMAISLLR